MLLPTYSTPCLMGGLSPERRNRLKERYRKIKKYGIRAGFAGLTGTGLVSLAQDFGKEQAFFHGKRYLGTILVGCGLTSISLGVPLLSNTTKVIKYGKACHSVCAAAWRASHNMADFPFILCDYAIFGEYVPSCGEADYDFFSPNVTDVIEAFTK